jgi:type I restriction enzyme S subunit
VNTYLERPLGDALVRTRKSTPVADSESYRITGIYSFGKGLIKRDTIRGSETTYRSLTPLRTGQLVMSKLNAWEGALSVVTSDFDGTYVSPEYPVFEINEESAHADYIRHLTSWSTLWERLTPRGSMVRRKRTTPETLLATTVPLPDRHEQQRVAGKLNELEHRISDVRSGQENARTLRATLRRTLIESALDSDSRQLQVGDLISLVRRPVDVVPDHLYREIGLRSFGKGVFHKVPVSGESIANKKVFHIEPGDLLFSNVFAWEGAAAIASERETGFIGSHRFMTYCVNEQIADPTFLLHYFCNGPGLDTIRAASPGSAGRNRTLGITAFASQTMTLPSLDKQKHIAKQLSCLARAEQIAEAQSAELSALSTAILNAAFTGQL